MDLFCENELRCVMQVSSLERELCSYLHDVLGPAISAVPHQAKAAHAAASEAALLKLAVAVLRHRFETPAMLRTLRCLLGALRPRGHAARGIADAGSGAAKPGRALQSKK